LDRDSISNDSCNGDGDSRRTIASCVGGRRERRPKEGPHRRQHRRVDRNAMGVDGSASTRPGPCSGRSETGSVAWRGPRYRETLLGRRSVWGRWSFRGKWVDGWAERGTLPPVAVGKLFRAEPT
jgi:hypothetical protein